MYRILADIYLGTDNAQWAGTDSAWAASSAGNYQGEREEDQTEQDSALPCLQYHWGSRYQPRGGGGDRG